MKKYIAMTAALLMCLSMVSCGDSEEESSSAKEKTTAATKAAETEETSETEVGDESSDDEENDDDMFGYAKAPEGVQEYRIVGYGFMGSTYSLDLIIGEDYDNYYNIEVEDHELAEMIGKFCSDCTLRTDASSGKLGDYELIDSDGNNLGMLTAEEIRAAYDPTLKYDIVDWSYDGEVKLSEFEEGKLYEAPMGDENPVFVNDTDTDYVIYVFDDHDYSETILTFPVNEIEGISRPEYDLFLFGDNIYVRVEPLTADMLSPDDSDGLGGAFVNGVAAGDEVEVGFANVLANAGDTDVDVEISTFDSDDPVEATIEAGKLYAIDWMNIISIVVK